MLFTETFLRDKERAVLGEWKYVEAWPWQTSSGKSVLANPLWSTINSTLFSSRETTEWLFSARLETLEKQSKF